MIRLGTWFCQKGRQVPMTSFPKTSGSLWWCPGSPNLLITCLYQNLQKWSPTTKRMCFSRPWNDPRMEVCWFCFSPLRMLLLLQNLKNLSHGTLCSLCMLVCSWVSIAIPAIGNEHWHGTWKSPFWRGKTFFKPPFLDSILLFQRVHLLKYSIFFHLLSIRASHLAHEALGQRLKVESLRLRLSAAGAPCRIKAVSNWWVLVR